MKPPRSNRSGFRTKAGLFPFLTFAALCRDTATIKQRFFGGALLLAIISGFLFLASGCASTDPLTAQQSNYPADKVDARGLFAENCVTCHGKNGRAHNFHGWVVGAQNFANLEWQMGTTDGQIVTAIKAGPGLMPAFANKLSPSEIEALAKYVRTFRTTE